MIKELTAKVFALMIKSGANNLSNNKIRVDELNVFPVPDGDTGTNMSKTFQNAALNISYESSSVEEVARDVASFTLRGARGNSGVILSQIFRGISSKAKGKKTIAIKDFVSCLNEGSDSAYRAVMKPTEGTILTVIKSCAKKASEYTGEDDFIDFFTFIVEGGNKTLKETTNMLPTLKQAGVVDAGGQGLMFIFEGMLYYLQNEKVIELEDSEGELVSSSVQNKVSADDIKFAYCTEFIIEKSSPSIRADKMRSAISKIGDCMVVIDDEDIIKVHIHTNNPGFVLEHAVRLGELSTIKIENMKIQHSNIVNSEAEGKNEEDTLSEPKVENAVISVSSGAGVEALFKDLGAKVISGGQTMNPSTEDILTAINKVNSDNVYILPNNKNIIMAAEQAAQISEKNIRVIKTKSIPQGISAMVVYDAFSSMDDNEKAMKKAAENVKTGLITHAVRDTSINDKEIHEGDVLGISEKDILFVGKDATEAAKDIIERISDDDTELITIIYGEDMTDKDAEALREFVEFKFPDSDVSVYNGGQPVYSYILSAE